jgi:hypothetical protein
MQVAAQRLDLTCSTAGAYEQVSQLLAGRAVHLDPDVLTVGVASPGGPRCGSRWPGAAGSWPPRSC